MPWSETKKRLAAVARQLKLRITYYRALYGDPRTPFLARALLWLAVGYALLPFDLIPDFIPVIGHLDDLIVVPALVLLAMRMVPEEVKRDHAARLGLDSTGEAVGAADGGKGH